MSSTLPAVSCLLKSAALKPDWRARDARSWRDEVIAAWRLRLRRLLDPYRPERHYMRGPGPKWREKHGPGAHTGGA